EGHTADQSFVGAVKPVSDQVSRWVKLLDCIRHDLTNQCPQLPGKRPYLWMVGREKLLKLAAHRPSFVAKQIREVLPAQIEHEIDRAVLAGQALNKPQRLGSSLLRLLLVNRAGDTVQHGRRER